MLARQKLCRPWRHGLSAAGAIEGPLGAAAPEARRALRLPPAASTGVAAGQDAEAARREAGAAHRGRAD
eukprot:13655089-Heterocapsa_arctica.AAC.1